MDPIILLLLINLLAVAFWGTAPPLIIGYLTLKKAHLMLKEAQKMLKVAEEVRDGIPEMMDGKGQLLVDEVIVYLSSDAFLQRMKNSAQGVLNRQVGVVKDRILKEHDLSGMPKPVTNGIAKGVGGYLSDYFGIKKKDAEEMVGWVFGRKKSKEQVENETVIVQAIAQDLGSDLIQ